MRPADVFEPGYDTVYFKQPDQYNRATLQETVGGGLHLSYKEACEAAYGNK